MSIANMIGNGILTGVGMQVGMRAANKLVDKAAPVANQLRPRQARQLSAYQQAVIGGNTDPYPDLYAKLKAERAKARAAALKSVDGSMTAAQYAKVLTLHANAAIANAREAKGVKSVTPALQREIEDIAAQLRTLAEAARAFAAKKPQQGMTPKTAYVQVRRWQDWLDKVTGVGIAKHDATVHQAHRALVEPAKKAAELAVDAAKGAAAAADALKWVVPVGLGVAGLWLLRPYVAAAKPAR